MAGAQLGHTWRCEKPAGLTSFSSCVPTPADLAPAHGMTRARSGCTTKGGSEPVATGAMDDKVGLRTAPRRPPVKLTNGTWQGKEMLHGPQTLRRAASGTHPRARVRLAHGSGDEVKERRGKHPTIAGAECPYRSATDTPLERSEAPDRTRPISGQPRSMGSTALRWGDIVGLFAWSGKRDLNPRLRPWQGRTLPLSYSRMGVRTRGPAGRLCTKRGRACQASLTAASVLAAAMGCLVGHVDLGAHRLA